MRVLDLFSGIGGFSLGLERAGMRSVAFCEIDPYCRAVLRKHWPDVPIYEDVRTLRAYDLFIDQCWPIDVICGGFPCQPFSSASRGRGSGTKDDRFLWPEMFRLIRDLGPTWVIGENVTHIDRLALEQVVSDLEGIGYEVAPPLEIPACAVGCDHRRARYWFLGYSDCGIKSELSVDAKMARMQGRKPLTRNSRATDGIPGGLDANRRKAIGNAIVPEIAEIIGKKIMDIERMDRARQARCRRESIEYTARGE